MVKSLRGLTVLVVEDEFYLADDLTSALTDADARVVGPFSRLEDALRVFEAREDVDLAVLDINLCGEAVFPLADRLRERRSPFVFATGYDRVVIPDRFSDAPRLEKPFAASDMINLLIDLHRGEAVGARS